MNPLILRVLRRATQSSDIILAGAVIAMVSALIVPLPGWLLDVGIAFNLVAAVTLLVVALNAKDVLSLASFPTLLLLTTLFRLSMNVSSTRLALAEGHAGQIIGAFGEFVVRGDYLVGFVLFVILTVVQFLVVAKGAERVAEVGARFTLDAMPGKQMAIDADVRAGAIDAKEARKRRGALERESQVYGAMDGAMKFIKGDVIAGLVITAVVLLGGFASGMMQGMGAMEALETYALLAIGDGLVSQIPSLCIAVAAGLLVTRVSSDEDASLSRDIARQFFAAPTALYCVGAMCLPLALVPGMPKIIFLLLGGAFGGLGYFLSKKGGSLEGAPSVDGAPAGEAPEAKKEYSLSTEMRRLILDLAPEISILAEEDNRALPDVALMDLREHMFKSLGVVVPPIFVRPRSPMLRGGQYMLSLDEVPLAGGVVSATGWLALAPPQELRGMGLQGNTAIQPATGELAFWVEGESLERARRMGFELRRPREVLCRHLEKLLIRNCAALFGVQELQTLLDAFEKQAPALVKEVTAKVSLPLLTDVFRRLLEEEVSIRNLRALCETLAAPTTEGDANALVEKCRQAVRRDISHRYAPGGSLFAYMTDPEIEQDIRTSGGGMLPPERVAQILEGARMVGEGGLRDVVVIAAPDVRRPLRRMCEHQFPNIAFLTYAELESSLQVRPLGRFSAMPVL